MGNGHAPSVWTTQDDWRARWRRASVNQKLRWLEAITQFVYRTTSRHPKRFHRPSRAWKI